MLRYGQRHPKCLHSAPYLQQPLQDSSLACTSLPLCTGSREFCLFKNQNTLLLWV